MADTREDPRRRMGWKAWVGIGLAAAIVLGLLVWAMISFRPAAEATGSTPTAPSTATATATASPQPTEFTAPTPGATDSVSKPDEPVEVALDEPAEPVEDVVVDVTSIEAVTAGRELPGESSGPAVAVSVRISNNGATPLDTGGSNVNLTYGGDERVPAVAVTDDDATVWPTTIAPGATATATFFFAVPDAPEGDIRVIVDLLATTPDVVFVGPRPGNAM